MKLSYLALSVFMFVCTLININTYRVSNGWWVPAAIGVVTATLCVYDFYLFLKTE